MQSAARILCLLLLCNAVTAQVTPQKQRENQFFVEPRESILPLIVHQPGCPIVFERLRYLHDVKGGGFDDYFFRNRGDKPIVYLAIATVYFKGGGSFVEYTARNQNEWIMPGKSWHEQGSAFHIIPIPEELRRQHEKDGEMKDLMIVLVVSIKFSDGSKYSDEKAFEALKTLRDRAEISTR
jgi:hypothetical protein